MSTEAEEARKISRIEGRQSPLQALERMLAALKRGGLSGLACSIVYGPLIEGALEILRQKDADFTRVVEWYTQALKTNASQQRQLEDLVERMNRDVASLRAEKEALEQENHRLRDLMKLKPGLVLYWHEEGVTHARGRIPMEFLPVFLGSMKDQA